MAKEQIRNKFNLTPGLCVHTFNTRMRTGRPPKPDYLKRSKSFPLRLTPDEWAKYHRASRESGEPVAEIIRKAADLYIRKRGKGGSRKKKEKTR
jgi:hypothetical protein